MKLVTIDTTCEARVKERWVFAVPSAWTDEEINNLVEDEGVDGFTSHPNEFCNFVSVDNVEVDEEHDREWAGHTITEVERLPEPEAPTVHVLHWTHKHGANVWVFDNLDALVRQKADIAREWYVQEVQDQAVVASIAAAIVAEDWEQVAELYFSYMDTHALQFIESWSTSLLRSAE